MSDSTFQQRIGQKSYPPGAPAKKVTAKTGKAA